MHIHFITHTKKTRAIERQEILLCPLACFGFKHTHKTRMCEIKPSNQIEVKNLIGQHIHQVKINTAALPPDKQNIVIELRHLWGAQIRVL